MWIIALPRTILQGFYKVHQGFVLVRLMMSNWKIILGNNWLWTTIWTWEIYDMLGFLRLWGTTCRTQFGKQKMKFAS